MPIIGEAQIIVKAITSGVERDIRNGFQKAEGIGGAAGKNLGKATGSGFREGFLNSTKDNFMGKLGDAFKSIEQQAEASRAAMVKIIRTSHFMSVGFQVLIGTIAQLVTSIGALGGAVVGAIASGMALVNVFAAIKIGSAVGKMAMGGIGQAVSAAGKASGAAAKTVKQLREEMQQLAFDAEEAALNEQDAALGLEKAREALARVQDLPPDNRTRREAELAFQHAELNYRKAKDRAKDLNEEINNPKKKNKTGTDPYAGLTKSQKKFAQYLVSIKGRMSELKEAAASGFLPALQTQMGRMLKGGLFDSLVGGFKKISSGLGKAVENFTDVILKENNLKAIDKFLSNIGKWLPSIGTILGNVVTGFVNLSNAAAGITQGEDGKSGLLPWLVGISEKFKDLGNDKKTQEFFKNAADSAKLLGDIIWNVLTGFGAIIDENVKPGSGGNNLLVWLKDATAGFADIGKQEGFGDMFRESAKGTKAMLQTFGDVLGLFLGFASDPNTTKFWETLHKNAPDMQKAFQGAADALPDVADAVIAIMKIIKTLSETDGVQMFFKILAGAFKILAPIIQAMSGIFKFVAPILAVASAVGLLFKGFKFLFRVLVGVFNILKKAVVMTLKFFGIMKKDSKNAKKDADKLDDGLEKVEKQLKLMNKRILESEKNFKKLHAIILKVNKALIIMRDKLGTVVTKLNAIKTSSQNANTQMRNLANNAKTTSTKMGTLKGKLDKTKTSLEHVRKKAKEAKDEINKLGRAKGVPKVGMSGSGMPGAGGGGEMPGGGLTILPGGGGKIAEMGSKLLKSPVGKLGIVGAVVAAVPVIVDAASEAADKARVSTKRLEGLARANGGFGKSAKKVADRLTEVADNMGGLTGQNYDNVKSVQELLLKYPSLATEAGKVNGKFDKMTGLALDLASVFNTDAPSAAQVMADAMADPATALDTLTGAGINFTDQEKKKYDQILASNGAAEAQDYLLQTLTDKYGGYAEKNADANDKITARFDTIGRKISEVFQPFNDWISKGLLWLVESIFGGEKSSTSKDIDKYWSGVAKQLNSPSNTSIGYSPVNGYADGGTIYPRAGGHVIRVAEAGKPERVEPLDKNGLSDRDKAIVRELSGGGGSGVTVNLTVNAPQGMDHQALTKLITSRLNFELRKGITA
jgi:hypothetical protein